MSSIHLIIPAAGLSQRLKGGVPKQFQTINGKMVLVHTLAAFATFPITACTVALSKPYVSVMKETLKQVRFPCAIGVVEGGETRAESVKNAVASHTACKWTLIHDAARPTVPIHVIDAVLHELTVHEAVIPVIESIDTLKYVEHNRVVRTIDRERVKQVQTPQGFHSKMLLHCYKHQEATQLLTDEAMMVEQAGVPIHVVPGDRRNIKLTHPEDVQVAQLVLQSDQHLPLAD